MPPAPGMPPKEPKPDEKTDDEPSENEDDEGVSTGNRSQLKKSLRAIIREELESIVAESIRKAEGTAEPDPKPIKPWLGEVTNELLDSLVGDDLNVSTRG